MSRAITVELSEAAFAALERRAQADGKSPADLAAAALEQRFGSHNGAQDTNKSADEEGGERFERYFGAVNLGHATGVDNEAIDADLARSQAPGVGNQQGQ